MSKKVKSKEELTNVATVSANNDRQIGQLISEAMETGRKRRRRYS